MAEFNDLAYLRELSECDVKEAADLKLKFDDDISEFLADECFMQECMAACLPTMVQMMVMDEDAEAMDEATREAFIKVNDYFAGQGLINEASAIRITNQKINVVHMGRKAQEARLATILVLKMARRENGGKGSKQYKKYKIAMKLKKENMQAMKAKHGAKAEKLAKKLWMQMQKSKKANAVVANAKDKK